jgi:hypothetical protein
MRDPALLSLLERLYHAEKNSFIRYVVGAYESELRDDADRRIFALYEEWFRESERASDAFLELLEAEGVVPDTSSYPIEFSQFNYLSPAYLVRHVVPRMEEHLASLADLGGGLAGWPEARFMVNAIVERQRAHLERLKRVTAEIPAPALAPPRIKGTSASRW